eukprot:269599_1
MDACAAMMNRTVIILPYWIFIAIFILAETKNTYVGSITRTSDVDISATASFENYTEYGKNNIVRPPSCYISPSCSTIWDGYFKFQFPNQPCYKPLLSLQKSQTIRYVHWDIDGIFQRIIYPSDYPCANEPLSNFELFTYDPYYTLTGLFGELVIYYKVFQACCHCNVNDESGSPGVVFYLKCLKYPFTRNSLTKNIPINISNSAFHLNVYQHFTFNNVSVENEHLRIYIYYRILNEACYLPKLSVSLQMDSGLSYISIEKNDAVHFLNFWNFDEINYYVLQNFDLTIYLSTDKIEDVLEVRIDLYGNATVTNVTCTLSCFLTDFQSIHPPKEQIKQINMEVTDNKFHYHSFHQLINSSQISQPLYAIFQMQNEACSNPLLSMTVLDTDFEGTYEIIEIYYLIDIEDYNQSIDSYITQCDPGGNTCANQYSCIDSFALSQDIKSQLVIKIIPTNNDPLCVINNQSISMYVNISLSCYAVEIVDNKTLNFKIDIENIEEFDSLHDFILPIYSHKTAQYIIENISMVNYPCFYPLLTI